MNTPLSERLRKQLGGPRDGALLRFSLGNALLSEDDASGAVDAFRAALEFKPDYSAAWKLLAAAQFKAGDMAAAQASYERGIEVAQAAGDIQAQKEMQVFLRRLRKSDPA